MGIAGGGSGFTGRPSAVRRGVSGSGSSPTGGWLPPTRSAPRWRGSSPLLLGHQLLGPVVGLLFHQLLGPPQDSEGGPPQGQVDRQADQQDRQEPVHRRSSC